ncbi:hypothetical protein B0H13DRAFT_2371831 [Mycena leptocephala]|nr:hypothetical protein B0H13DRAFT_2371831 [Mycena leptocephala]
MSEAQAVTGSCTNPVVVNDSPHPMALFRPMKGFFLDELLRHEGLGDDLENPRCAHCACSFDTQDPNSPCLFKCFDCGQFLQCEDCCVSHHQRAPLHVIEEWNGHYWIDSTLAKLGIIYQLGHGGWPCTSPEETVREMTVIEAPIIHQVKIRFCGCSKSYDADNLEQLMRNAWYPATVTDPKTCATFRSLESYRLYNVAGNLNVEWDDICYKQFQRMARQWAFLKRLKRAGRGHDPAGVGSTKLGECAVHCWACPYDGRNLPTDWRDVDPKYQFLYMLLLAVDANFRLKNCMRAHEINDPSLGPGWGYWVEPEKYKEHLSKYVHEKDISTCIAFATLLQKDTRLTTGLRVSGLEELYANMDFIVMSALVGFALILLTISYDIACQWKRGEERWRGCRAHLVSLESRAYSTKDAGLGQRADTLEGKIDNHNYLKNVAKALQRKLITISRDVREHWTKMINTWLEDESQPNPYILKRKDCPTEAEVRVDVRKDEEKLTTAGQAPIHGRSATAFLTAGIQIEDAQRRIIGELAGTVLVAADRENKIQEWRHALLVKIGKFRGLQKIYMPGAAATIEAAEARRDSDAVPPKPEKVAVWMPSDMPRDDPTDTLPGCVPGLVNMEARLRVAQCDNSLVSLRARLHTKRFLIGFRNENIAGQVQATKARTLIGQVGERADGYAKRYRKGRAALVSLKGVEEYPHLWELKPEDITLDGDAGETDAASRKKLVMIGMGRGARVPRNAPGTSKRLMSWIEDRLAAWHERLAGFFRIKWDVPALTVAHQMVAVERADLDDFFGED